MGGLQGVVPASAGSCFLQLATLAFFFTLRNS
jgi:hypothetical protein